ncbi:sorting nexin-17-like [Centruroides vittatus]|uniref:sorting nexin-17-like n=1 Tax=Centruroides sculpturatus TaxID=218467 RepID=UPI000C6D84D6|nr:sorting nexin-17-like [Centruroides sculpturatus]
MHFSIPDMQEVKDDNGSSYVAYNIHINGSFHCTVRYKQMHSLHEQLRKEYGPNTLPCFPPKKLLPLTPAQTEERRALLEKYVQLVSQDSRVASDDLFNGFLLNAQQETLNAKEEEVDMDIYLMNWQKVSIHVMSIDPTSLVLEAVAKAINLQFDLICYFCIYLINKKDNEIIVKRQLQDFEAPYLSLQAAGAGHYLIIRKSYWDLSYDDDLLDDRTALNLLYVQAISDVERGWTITTKETQQQLAALQAKGSKKEYLQLARTLKYYGYIQFQPCKSDFPQQNSKVIVSAGGRELSFRVQIASGLIKEINFRVTRIRCWRITTSISDKSKDSDDGSDMLKLELSFEYLVNKDKLQWITITSEQAIMMSMCLQGMVDELLVKKTGSKFRCQPERTRRGSWSYMKRDGSSHQLCVSRSVSSDSIVHGTNDKLSGLSLKSPTRSGNGSASPKTFVENDAFEGIGDEDL